MQTCTSLFCSDTIAFATEPVFVSLANVLGYYDNLPSPLPLPIKVNIVLYTCVHVYNYYDKVFAMHVLPSIVQCISIQCHVYLYNLIHCPLEFYCRPTSYIVQYMYM